MDFNSLNVFKGNDSLEKYLDPDQNIPLPLVELPDSLNPLRSDGVRIFAKMLTALPAHNVKSLPALQMLRAQPEARNQTIVEASSGSTVFSLAILARALWGNEDVHAYVTNKKHPDSLRLLKFFGLKTVLYGGLAQQEPSDPKGVMGRLRRLAESDQRIYYPGQYHNDENWKSHERWTGAQIWKQLPEVNVFCATIGTGGCITGTGAYLKAMKPSVKTIGVCSNRGDPVPGPRYFSGFHTCPFPWRETIDVFETTTSADAFLASMQLSRHGLIAGPSSGQALSGLVSYLQAAKADGRLGELADPITGEVNCVFACADLPYQYMDLYFKKIPEHEFPSVINQNLLTCDLETYDERWFLCPEDASQLVAGEATMCPTPSRCDCTRRQQDVVVPLPHHLADSPSLGISSSPPCSFQQDPPLTAPIPTPPESRSGALGDEDEGEGQPVVTRSAKVVAVVDLRPEDEYGRGHLCAARNVPLSAAPAEFFGDARAVEERWREIRAAIEGPSWPGASPPAGEVVQMLVVCSDGDSARMTVAILRAQGIEAFSVEGGHDGLVAVISS